MAVTLVPPPLVAESRLGHPGETARRPMLGFVGQVVAWMAILTITTMVVVIVVIPRIAGAEPYTVLTTSMRPTLPPGTLVVVEPADPDSIGIGSVITYQISSGKHAVVTHRVVAMSWDRDGKPIWRTQGDANGAVDEGWVRAVQLKGVVWYSVPYLGWVNTLLTGEQRRLVSYVVAGALLLYAGGMWSGAYRDHRRKRGRT